MILDWVPAHFPRDEWALARFDGTALYEHADPRRGAHPDWGTLVFNFAPQRGAQLPARERALLAARVPRRRPARRRGRLDALPRLLAQGRASGSRTCTAAARTSTSIAFLRELNEVVHADEPGRDLGGRGVDRVAGRLAAGLPRRARLRLQVEHGLDARHARLLRARPGAPPLPPPRADLLDDLRVHRELRPAALPRRGRAREGLAARARCRATAGSSSRTSARCTRYMWAHPGKKLLFMGGELAQEQRVEPRRRRSTGTCSSGPSTPACSASSAT